VAKADTVVYRSNCRDQSSAVDDTNFEGTSALQAQQWEMNNPVIFAMI
jgi:hypothetical protein